jgi:SNF family Na+-dependent transporter
MPLLNIIILIVGSFIIPYVIMLFVLGIPLFYLELSLGQAVRKGPVKAWFELSPNLGGIGISSLVVNGFIVIYYNVIIAWVLFFLFNTFHKNLPWGICYGHVAWNLDSNETSGILSNISAEDLPGASSCFNATTE